MSEKPKMNLSEQGSTILRDICFARMKVLKVGDIGIAEDLSKYTELDELVARKSLPVFDFFRSAMAGHEEAVRRLSAVQNSSDPHVGCVYYDGMIGDYRSIMTALMHQGGYTAEDVLHLQNCVKGYVKALKIRPARTLYIADCHFYHRRLNTEMDNRGFSSVEEMNEYMIRQWNAKVTEKDTVYILGDFSLAGGFQTSGVLECLNGKKHLIIGNHDDRYLGDKFFEDHRLRSVKPYVEIRDKGRIVILSHYPIFCYKGQYRKDKQGNSLTYMLYGHVHNSHDEVLINRFIAETKETKVKSAHATQPEPIPCNMINCFCMFSNYQPMTLDEWITIDRKRREKMGNIATE